MQILRWVTIQLLLCQLLNDGCWLRSYSYIRIHSTATSSCDKLTWRMRDSCTPTACHTTRVTAYDLSWSTHIEHIIKKATTRLYFLKQLKTAGLSNRHLLRFYITVIRPLLEYYAPEWHYTLTKVQSESLEAVQKCANHITHNFRWWCVFIWCIQRTGRCLIFAAGGLMTVVSIF